MARYEAARAWFKSGDRRRARDGFTKWYDDNLAAGIVPLVDHDFREAFYGDSEHSERRSAATNNAFSRKLLDAAKILATLGKEDLAWAYATAPLASGGARRSGQPGGPSAESPYAALARQLAERGESALALRAYVAAEAAEPTNARLVWDRAQLLEKHGRFAEARALYRRLADGEWPAEQTVYKQQAAERVSRESKAGQPGL